MLTLEMLPVFYLAEQTMIPVVGRWRILRLLMRGYEPDDRLDQQRPVAVYRPEVNFQS